MKFVPTIGSQYSGSIDGVTASRNRGGPYFRSRETPVNPNTARQSTARESMGIASSSWSSLTESQRQTWHTIAPDVTPTTPGASLTGQNVYHMQVLPLYQANGEIGATLTVPTSAPIYPTQTVIGGTSPSVSSADASSGFITVAYDDSAVWAATTGGGLLVYVGRPQSPGRSVYHGQYRLAGMVVGSTGSPPTSPATISSPWSLSAGDKLWIRTVAFEPAHMPSISDQAGPVVVVA